MRILICLLLMLFSLNGTAQDKKSQDALRRMQALNQRLASEKAQLEREKAQLAKENAEAEAARKALASTLKGERGTTAGQKQEIEKLGQAGRELEAKLADALKREEALQRQLAETEKALAESRAGGELLARRVANQAGTIGLWQEKTASCEAKNGELAKLGHELAERYRAKTCGDAMQDNEPFTGIGRARMENLLEDYKDRLRAQRFDARQEAAGSGVQQ